MQKSFQRRHNLPPVSFLNDYKVIAENYEEAIAIHVSAKMSGTLASSQGGAEIAGFPYHIHRLTFTLIRDYRFNSTWDGNA